MNKLIECLSIQTESYNQWRMFAYIIRQLSEIPGVEYFVEDGNIYAQRGEADAYPCMVAHMDTVHDITDDLYPLVFNGKITGFDRVNMVQTGIGGDDKVGVYIALECLREFDNMKVAFFRDEEVGCVGSQMACMWFFSDCRFVLQCDRRGNSDFITEASGVELSSKFFQDELKPIITAYGYSYQKGMMTDVMALKENQIGCSVANISCGYYNPHSADEYVDVFDVENCLEMCKTIIKYCTDSYPHAYKPRVYVQPAAYSKYGKRKSFWDWSEPKENSIIYNEEPSWYEATKKPTYCRECWAGEVVTSDGLCEDCERWYTKAYQA
jgi:tripeptide aminopeptidase